MWARSFKAERYRRSGKTTLLNCLLAGDTAEGPREPRRLLVLENEVGAVNVSATPDWENLAASAVKR